MIATLRSLTWGAIDLPVRATFEGNPRRQTMGEIAQDARLSRARRGMHPI